ncbi:MAG: Holliday junction resolvase [Candidatus Methanoliparum thermophilum]|uniref:Crossover junction endodeoxyribonuclease Hjc n=1 Tax=Methanoliparum thermophilum TaxID=2491083 RepID=A0A520KSE6_METT2|nr:MAG: Holliday junction resolvase [Candidatus Methanoliparum thermophilum]
MKHRGRKGTDSERELVNMLWKAGFAAIRSPASGAATKNPLPDIIAGNGKRYLSIEVKSSSKGKIYIKKREIEDLAAFSKKFGAEPYLGVKFNGERWAFICVERLDSITKDGNYRIDLRETRQTWMDFDELLGKSRQVRL